MMGFAGCGWFERSKLAEHNVRQAVNDTTKGHRKHGHGELSKPRAPAVYVDLESLVVACGVLAQAMCVKFQKHVRMFCLIID